MIRIKLILPPHKELTELARTTFIEHNEFYKSADREKYEIDIVEIMWLEMDKFKFDADVVISRGVFAEVLKVDQKSIPIVEIPFDGNDLVRCLYKCKEKYGDKKIAIIAPKNVIYGVDNIANIFGLTVKSYEIKKQNEAEPTIGIAAKDGCQVVISGLLTCEYARRLGMETVFTPTGKEALWKALTEAKRAAKIGRREQEKAELFKTILDYAYEGVVAVDNKKQISVFNMAAQKILDINDQGSVGKNLEEILPESALRELLNDKSKHLGTIIKQNKVQLAVNKVPIVFKGENVGHMVTFEDITKIQEMEEKIRKEIHRRGHFAKYTFQDIIGETGIMKETIQTAKKISEVGSNILIIGETGTGKEFFAQSIHSHSILNKGPFVAVNCAALPENLLESELFGYVEGAFTGAAKGGKPGLFELAHKGTIFLDEISEISLSLQSRLLRVIEEKEIMRLGHDRVIPVDVRIISATNKDLYTMVEKGTFREDLYYRLNVLKLNLPALRERKEDIPLLAEKFILGYTAQFKKQSFILTEEAKNSLKQIKWTGNIRELRNICERLVVLSKSNIVTGEDIKGILDNKENMGHFTDNTGTNITSDPVRSDYNKTGSVEKRKVYKILKRVDDSYVEEFKSYERKKIQTLLEEENYNKLKVAERLGVNRTTLWRWMKGLEMI